MINLIIVTSIINPPKLPLSYCNIRSIFTREERFNDTKKTFESIKKIPNSIIILVECSDFIQNEYDYFVKNTDYIINLWENKEIQKNIFGISKSLGEGTMTIEALKFIINNNIKYDNLFKISGRYFLNDDFNYDIFNNNYLIFKKINNDINNISTVLYKIPYSYTNILYNFLINNLDLMNKCIGYEILFGLFLKTVNNELYILYNNLGVSGKVTVCGSSYNG